MIALLIPLCIVAMFALACATTELANRWRRRPRVPMEVRVMTRRGIFCNPNL